MSQTDSGLKALLPKKKKKKKKYRVSVGDALFVIVYPNGGKYFILGVSLSSYPQRTGVTIKSVLMGKVQGSGH